MSLVEGAARVGWLVAALAAVLLLAFAGRLVARALRQPAVIGEVAFGLAASPLVLAVAGPGVAAALPLDWLGTCGHIGLVLFLVGVIHELRSAPRFVRGRAIGWTTAGAVAVPLAAGAGLAAWVLTGGDGGLRGDAPAASLAVFLAVSLSVTAVPVLARILSDHNLVGTRIGTLAMTVAVVTDAAAWLLVALAVSLKAGGLGELPALAGLIVVALLGAFAVRRVLGTPRLLRLAARRPRLTALFVAAWGLGVAAALRSWGLTEVLGAALAALAIPTVGTNPDRVDRDDWGEAVRAVARVGRLLVPVFFVVTGFSVFAEPFAVASWSAIALVTLVGLVGKVGGAYAGARLGGEPREVALSLGVLLNTRGLTELVVLQIGYDAGILTPAMFLALAVMALVTTALTGPSYALIQYAAHRRPRTVPVPVAHNGGL
ncbi:cation:proton antiporter [Microtetraspora malaysiensis]|uniref:Cation:proton antiporter n=1 Tax=Microtetraspora malaysiensis TaxID=161358 RepID=A0ABW6T618_9ACTN